MVYGNDVEIVDLQFIMKASNKNIKHIKYRIEMFCIDPSKKGSAKCMFNFRGTLHLRLYSKIIDIEGMEITDGKSLAELRCTDKFKFLARYISETDIITISYNEIQSIWVARVGGKLRNISKYGYRLKMLRRLNI